MQRFFFDDEIITDGRFEVTGEKFNHIVRVLRMTKGERAIFCDGKFTDFECELIDIMDKSAIFNILNSYRNKTEPELKITVFQCLPKGEKMEEMIKRCVQFGAYEIVPVLSKRCVSRPDKKSMSKKFERYNKVSRSSAMQSMRGCIPEVQSAVSFEKAIEMLKKYPLSFICYENEMDRIVTDLNIDCSDIAFLVGPEGGLDKEEVDFAEQNGIESISLGKRILRTEDAAAFLIPILLSQTNNL